MPHHLRQVGRVLLDLLVCNAPERRRRAAGSRWRDPALQGACPDDRTPRQTRLFAASAADSLDSERTPLPLAARNVRPSGETANAVGYQPTGIKPAICDSPGWGDIDHHHVVVVGVGHVERLAVGGDGHGVGRAAFRRGRDRAKWRGSPAALRRTPLGAGPGFHFFQVCVWITWTVLSPEQATKSRPSGERAISLGRMPTAWSRTRGRLPC